MEFYLGDHSTQIVIRHMWVPLQPHIAKMTSFSFDYLPFWDISDFLQYTISRYLLPRPPILSLINSLSRWIHGKQLLIAPFVGVSWWWLGSEHSSCLKMSTTKKRFRIRLCIILFFAGKEHRSNFHARFRVGKFFAYHHVAFQTPVLRTDVRVSCAKSMGTRESWGRRLRTYSDGSGGNTWHRHIMSLRISRTPGDKHPCLCIRRLSWVIFPRR